MFRAARSAQGALSKARARGETVVDQKRATGQLVEVVKAWLSAEAQRTQETLGGDAWVGREYGRAGGLTFSGRGAADGYLLQGVSDLPNCSLLDRNHLLSFYRINYLRLGVEILTMKLRLRSWGDEVRADLSAPPLPTPTNLDVRADAWRTQGAPPREGASMG